jgi:hypothetical protein
MLQQQQGCLDSINPDETGSSTFSPPQVESRKNSAVGKTPVAPSGEPLRLLPPSLPANRRPVRRRMTMSKPSAARHRSTPDRLSDHRSRAPASRPGQPLMQLPQTPAASTACRHGQKTTTISPVGEFEIVLPRPVADRPRRRTCRQTDG